jgi:hypothetical protein
MMMMMMMMMIIMTVMIVEMIKTTYPFVSVPVLSRATELTAAIFSTTDAPRINTPDNLQNHIKY